MPDFSIVTKALMPRYMDKAIRSFDRSTSVVIGACWGGGLLIMLFALYTISLSVTARREAITAQTGEPSLPLINTQQPSHAEMQPILLRLQKLFPEINFLVATDDSLTVTATDGNRFRTWLTVLSYIDTISPQYRWTMRDFCVGMGCGSSPMRAVLVAEKISFSPPRTGD